MDAPILGYHGTILHNFRQGYARPYYDKSMVAEALFPALLNVTQFDVHAIVHAYETMDIARQAGIDPEGLIPLLLQGTKATQAMMMVVEVWKLPDTVDAFWASRHQKGRGTDDREDITERIMEML